MSFMDKLKEGLEKATEEVGELAQVGKMRIEISRLADRRNALYCEIGRQVYEQYTQGRLVTEYEAKCRELRDLENQIGEKETEIRRMQDTPSTPGTGSPPKGSGEAAV